MYSGFLFFLKGNNTGIYNHWNYNECRTVTWLRTWRILLCFLYVRTGLDIRTAFKGKRMKLNNALTFYVNIHFVFVDVSHTRIVKISCLSGFVGSTAIID